jgi:hypothetical protein
MQALLPEILTKNFFILGILWFVAMWGLMPMLISRASGWALLAEQYRFPDTFTGSTWTFQKGQMRWLVGYNNCLTVGADPRGLYLKMFFLFRAAHPPLFIPWRDISYVTKKFLWVDFVELRLGREVPIPLRINLALAQKLKSAAATSWPIEAVA